MAKEKIRYNKLIRDRIPDIILGSGGDFETRVMDPKEFRVELFNKLREEIEEVENSPDNRLLDELADTLEVLEEIGNNNGLNFSQLRKDQLKRRQERGGFKKRLFLIWSIWGNKK